MGIIAAFTFAIALAAPSQAHTGQQDQQFLSALSSAGWSINNASTLINQGVMVCDEGLAHGVSVQEMHTTLMGYGYSSSESSTLISKAVSVYCPGRSDAVSSIGADSGGGGGAKDQDDLFVQQLSQRNSIVIDKAAAVDMARTACSAPLAGPGLNDAWLAMQQRYPKYNLATVASVMSEAVPYYCPQRMS